MLCCKGSCGINNKYITKKVVRGETNGFKRCTICAIYIKWEGNYCPCCGVKLKTSPTNNKARKAHRKRMGQKSYNLI
jgi:rRNA maturation endonuclease Nob1